MASDSGGHPGEVTESKSIAGIDGGTITMQRELVYPGKGGRLYEYWYAMQRHGDHLHRVYVGSKYDEKKARARLRVKIKGYKPC